MGQCVHWIWACIDRRGGEASPHSRSEPLPSGRGHAGKSKRGIPPCSARISSAKNAEGESRGRQYTKVAIAKPRSRGTRDPTNIGYFGRDARPARPLRMGFAPLKKSPDVTGEEFLAEIYGSKSRPEWRALTTLFGEILAGRSTLVGDLSLPLREGPGASARSWGRPASGSSADDRGNGRWTTGR